MLGTDFQDYNQKKLIEVATGNTVVFSVLIILLFDFNIQCTELLRMTDKK